MTPRKVKTNKTVRMSIGISEELNDTISKMSDTYNKSKNEIITMCLEQYIPLTDTVLKALTAKNGLQQYKLLKQLFEFSNDALKDEGVEDFLIKRLDDDIKKNPKNKKK